MATKDQALKKVMLHLLKDTFSMHTTTLISKELGLSRVGTWKILKRLEKDRCITIKTAGKGRTSTSLISLNWENQIIEKMLSLYLAEEAIKQRRWQVNFSALEKITDFTFLYGSILYSPKEGGDIDILGITSKQNFVKIQKAVDNVQKTQYKKIHSLNFTEKEFKTELKRQNKAFIDAIKRGIVLFGQENFVKFMGGIAR